MVGGDAWFISVGVEGCPSKTVAGAGREELSVRNGQSKAIIRHHRLGVCVVVWDEDGFILLLQQES